MEMITKSVVYVVYLKGWHYQMWILVHKELVGVS